ncbi:MAG: hypothetical protein Q9160_005437 [Pyrenula sp. 1 TL-2023]
MSYHGLTNYNPYYAPPSNQSTESSYTSNRQPSTGSSLQQATPTQQYGQSNYNWPSQTHQRHDGLSGENQGYSSQSWKGGQNQQPSYNYQKPRNDYGAPASNSTVNVYYGASSQAPAQSGTHALSSLAYASGLESAGMQNQNQNQNQNAMDRGSQSSTPVSATYPQTIGLNQERVRSPAQAPYHNYSRSNNSNSYTDNRPRSAQQSLAASAAVALAGAARRHHTPSSQPTTRSAQYPSSMGNILSTPSNTIQSPIQARSDSPYQRHSGAPQVSQQPQRMQGQSTNQYGSYSGQYNPPPTDSARYSATVDQPQPQTIRSPYQAPAEAVRSISEQQDNSALPTSTEARDGHYSTNPSLQTEPSNNMPNFIDPSQVYNPYHQEHERRRKEAAAKSGAEAVQSKQQDQQQNQQPFSLGFTDQAGASEPASPGTKVAEKPKKVLKARKSRKSDPLPKAGEPNSIARQSLTPQAAKPAVAEDEMDGTEAMENEMKAMFDKMRHMRSKDPSMFAKLWEGMKKGGNSAQNDPTPTQPPQLSQTTITNGGQVSTATSSTKTAKKVTFDDRSNDPRPATTENSKDNSIDLGKFPAARRGRYGKNTERSQPISSEPINAATVPHLLDTSGELEENGPSNTSSQQNQREQDKQMSHPDFASAPAMANSSAKLQWKDPKTAYPQAATVANGTTVWPAAKRKGLADAAVKVLMSNPANRDNLIRPEDILALLDRNPSYTELCESLEARGLAFSRGQFARHLLNNVPDMKSASSQAQSSLEKLAVIQSPTLQAHTASASSPQVTKGSTQQPIVKPEAQPASNKSNQSKKPSSSSRPTKYLGQPTPPIPKPAPGSKEAQARKRDFSELVDLTLLSDDENYVMPSKKARIEEDEPAPPSPEIHDSGSNTNLPGPPVHQNNYPNRMNADSFIPLTFNTQSPAAQPVFYPPSHVPQGAYHPPFVLPLPPFAITAPSGPPRMSSSWMAKSVDRKEAMSKKFYNPKTIARDILIASGCHPIERALNDHLVTVARRFNLNFDADLSTFDWDSIDPGGPPVRSIQIEDIPAGPPKWASGQRMHPSRPKEQKHLQPRHQLMNKFRLGSTAVPKGSQPISGGQASAYPTANIYARHFIPGTPQSSLARLQNKTNALKKRSLDSSKDTDNISSLERPDQDTNVGAYKGQPVTPQPRKSELSNIPNASAERPSPQNSKQSGKHDMDVAKKRVGRPPGSKNKSPRFLKGPIQATKESPSGVQVQVPVHPSPRFHLYSCRWAECDSKLHNLETLRRHTNRHLQNDALGRYPCHWKGCRYAVKTGNDKEPIRPLTLSTQGAWRKHIDVEHLEPIAKKYGDGPSAEYSGKPLNLATAAKPVNLSQFAFNASATPVGPMPMSFPPSSPTSSSPQTTTHITPRTSNPMQTPTPVSLPTPSHTSPNTNLNSHPNPLPTIPSPDTDPTTVATSASTYLNDPTTGANITPPHFSSRAAMSTLEPDPLILPAERKPQRDFMKSHGNPELNEVKSAKEVVRALKKRKERIPGIERGGCRLVTPERRKTLVQIRGGNVEQGGDAGSGGGAGEGEGFMGVVDDEHLDSD